MSGIIQQFLDEAAIRVPDLFFVEIGAMDGKHFDSLYPYVQKHHWSGLLVEPLPDLFEELKRNYHGHDNLIFENIAVTEQEEQREMTRIPVSLANGQCLPWWTKGIASFLPSRNALGGVRQTEELAERIKIHSVVETVRCSALQPLLDRHKISRIDVLHIDTEGYDFHVLKQVDFNRYRPFVIVLEYGLLPSEEKVECLKLLRHFGYTCFRQGLDLAATIWPVHPVVTEPPEVHLKGKAGGLRL